MKTKKIMAFALTGAIACATLLGGCGKLNADETLITIKTGDTTDSISLGYGNFATRYTQSNYDGVYLSYYGNGYWSQEVEEGKTFEDQVKESAIDAMEQEYLLAKHAQEYGIIISEDEQKKIDEAAKKFMESNKESTLEELTASEEVVKQYLTNQYYSTKVAEAIKDQAEVNVTDEEAAQRKITYAYISTVVKTDSNGSQTPYEKDELAQLKPNAEKVAASSDFENEAKELGFTVKEKTYGADETELNEAVVKAADALTTEGEISSVVEVENDGYYIIRLDSKYDKEASDAKKTELEEKARTDYFNQILDGWKGEITWTVNDKVWSKVKFDSLFKTEDK